MSIVLHVNNSCSFVVLGQARRSFGRMYNEEHVRGAKRNGAGALHERRSRAIDYSHANVSQPIQ